MPVEAADAIQEKWLKVASVNDGAGFFVPDYYGEYRNDPHMSCSSSSFAWTNDCSIPRTRRLRLNIDPSGCEAVNWELSYSFTDAAIEWANWMRSDVGWDVQYSGPQFQPTINLNCDYNQPDAMAVTFRNPAALCWDLPANLSSKDICFYNSSGGRTEVNIGMMASKILPVGTYPLWQVKNLMRNTMFHELGHSAGLGHTNGMYRVMNNGANSDFYQFPLVHHTNEINAFRDFNPDFNMKQCNWIPGDPIGNACPHEAP